MKKLYALIFNLLLATTAFAATPSTGLYIKSDCTTIPNPVSLSTWCLKTTDGLLYGYNGSSYAKLTVNLSSQGANLVLAGPSSGGAGAATFRSLVSDDIPNLSAAKITSGTLPIARGGTNATSFTANRCIQMNAGGTALESSSSGCAGAQTFDQIGSGTNTTATMTVGTGASLTTSGSGSNTATAVKGLTASRPLVSDVSGNLAVGSGFSGNTTTVATTTGSLTSGFCAQFDASGNIVAASGACGIAGSGYGTIQDEGSNLTARTTANFIGAGVTAADDAGNSRTNITIPGGMTALTGDVTASGTGSQAATIASDAVTTSKILNANVTLGKIANASANDKLLGSGNSGSGASYSEITIGSGLAMSGTTLSTSGGSGGLTLVEHKTVTSNSTTLTFSGLDGDTDGVYRIIGHIKANSQARFYLRPNAVTTNLSRAGWRVLSSGNFAGDNDATWEVHAADVNSGGLLSFSCDINARKSVNSVAVRRSMVCQFVQAYFSGGGTDSGFMNGIWDETSTNMTTLDFMSTTSSAIANGSELWLYKYAQ